MMYKHVNGFLPDAMNALYITNIQVHDHYTNNNSSSSVLNITIIYIYNN